MTWQACERCIERSWLLARLAGHLDVTRGRTLELLELEDEELILAVAGAQRTQVERDRAAFDPARAREEAQAAGLEAVCLCDASYPRRLGAISAAPAALHVAGGLRRLLDLADKAPIALVGARRASPYGLDMARALARDLARAGLTVVSGMAQGIDSAAHRGALDAGGPTVAVLPGGPERPYPARHRALHRRIRAEGAVVSELPPGTPVRRWMFPARNRILAGLAAMTVVVEAREGSGALLTAAAAARAGRPVGAVPGPATSPLAAGPHELLRGGALLVTGADDVLEALFGPAVRPSGAERSRRDAGLEPALAALLEALAEGQEPAPAIRRAGIEPERGLAALAALELAGLVRREPGGRYAVLP